MKDDSRKHTVNLFLLLLPRGCRTNSEQGGNTVDPQILKRELYGNFLAFAKGYQFSSKMCQRLRDCHPIIITLAHPEDRRRSSHLRAQRISRRGEDVILTPCPQGTKNLKLKLKLPHLLSMYGKAAVRLLAMEVKAKSNYRHEVLG